MSYREWIELESDPGLFSLLICDFGVKDVEVEEVYDLSKPIEKDVFGFIFLFKWMEERKSRRKAALVSEETNTYDKEIEDKIFFAEQIIPNSCASHALLSVLLNVPNLSLGYTLTKLRDSTIGFDAETKGYAIGNFQDINVAHNNHGRSELRWQQDRSKNITGSGRSMEAFHYVSYIPYNKQLYELDGLKPHPINHGPWFEDESWTDKARRVIQDRIQLATGGELSHDIRYNLMAVVPEQKKLYLHKMEILSHNKKVLIEVFKKLSHQESFVDNAFKSTNLFQGDMEKHPFIRKGRKRSSNEFGPQSPSSSCSSTVTGQESPTNPFSDSEDSSVETHRIKAIMRGQMVGPVYVYSESSDKKRKIDNKDLKNENNDLENTKKSESVANETNKETIVTDSNASEKKPEMITAKVCEDNKDDEAKDNIKEEVNEESSTEKESSKTQQKVEVNESSSTTAPTINNLNENNIQINNDTKKQSDNEIVKSSPSTEQCQGASNENIVSEITEDAGNDKAQKEQTDDIKKEPEENLTSDNNKPGLGVEIIADDADITSLLDQNRLEKLSFDEIIKYGDKIKLKDLQHCMQEIDEIYKSCESTYKEELEKIERFKIDDSRRRHNYDPFISTFLTMLAEQGIMAQLLEEQNSVMKRVSSSSSLKTTSNNNNNITNTIKKDLNNKTVNKKNKATKKINKKKKKKV